MENECDMMRTKKMLTLDDVILYVQDLKDSIVESKREGLMTVGQADRLERLERLLGGWLGDNRSPVGQDSCENEKENEVKL